ncbi:hypothetical protein QQ045_020518 [Rhodiola kirilowii]
MNGREYELRKELWHANAGTNIFIPQVGDLVVYYAQGHLEQVKACTNQDGNLDKTPLFKLPSKILCRVIDVHLKVTSPSSPDISRQEMLESDYVNDQSSSLPSRHVKTFTKILTSSDTSAQGGFTVPKRLAEEAFPSLDMSQEPPFQDLIATDIHGKEWNFRHIYRGNPKRHLITSGWHTFVARKQIIAGDKCTFLKGPNGELGIGIHRTSSRKDNSSTFVISSHDMQLGLLASAKNALLYGTPFAVYYYPWSSPSGFIINYNKYMQSVKMQCAIGTRFTASFEGYDSKRKKSIGKVVAIDDLDSDQWPSSEWRGLKVEWEDASDELPTRISAWNIESLEPRRARSNFTKLPPRKRFSRPPGLAQSDFFSSKFQSRKITGKAAIGSSCSWPLSDPFASHEPKCYKEPDEVNNLVAKQKELDKQHMVFGFDLASTLPEIPSQQSTTLDELTHCRKFTPMISPATSDNRNASERCLRVANSLIHSSKCCCFTLPSLAKVHKEGCDASIAVDLTRFKNYDELIIELDKMFKFEGKLIDGSADWAIKYIDHDDELCLLGGDYPWQTFQMVVKRLLICLKQNIVLQPTES